MRPTPNAATAETTATKNAAEVRDKDWKNACTPNFDYAAATRRADDNRDGLPPSNEERGQAASSRQPPSIVPTDADENDNYERNPNQWMHRCHVEEERK